VLIPAVNRAGLEGWDMVKVAADVKAAAEAQGQQVTGGLGKEGRGGCVCVCVCVLGGGEEWLGLGPGVWC